MKYAHSVPGILLSSALLLATGAAQAQLGPPITEFSFVTIECSDGLDNDGDGRFDYPDDPDCVDAQDEAERTPTPTRRARFRPVREPRGAESTGVWALSRDGRTMVGSISQTVQFPGFEEQVPVGSVVWRRGRPHLIEDLRPLVTEGFQGSSAAGGVSADGRIVTGAHSSEAEPIGRRAYLWQDGVLTDLESPLDPNGFLSSAASAVSNTGAAVGLWFNQPARWDEAGLTLLEPSPSDVLSTAAIAITPDGATTVGSSRQVLPVTPETPFPSPTQVATVWFGEDSIGVPLAPFDELQFVTGSGRSRALDVSDDGRVIVGEVHTFFPLLGATYGFRWRDGELEYFGLGTPDVSFPNAALYGVSADGSLAVGQAVGIGPVVLDGQRLRSLSELLVNEYGVDLRGWDLNLPTAFPIISGNGRVIVARGRRPDGTIAPYKVKLPPACADGLDNDGDGWTDFGEDRGCRSRSDRSEERRRRRHRD